MRKWRPTDIGVALEREARRADTAASRKWVGELSTYLDRVDLDVTADVRVKGKPTAGAARRIVLVEDDDDLRGVSREVLEQRGHLVKEARDGIEGLALILAERPDVAIVDLGMPRMNGHEVARQVRAAPGPLVRLVAMTGHGKARDRLQALSAGFDTLVAKPVDIELVERLLEALPAQAP